MGCGSLAEDCVVFQGVCSSGRCECAAFYEGTYCESVTHGNILLAQIVIMPVFLLLYIFGFAICVKFVVDKANESSWAAIIRTPGFHGALNVIFSWVRIVRRIDRYGTFGLWSLSDSLGMGLLSAMFVVNANFFFIGTYLGIITAYMYLNMEIAMKIAKVSYYVAVVNTLFGLAFVAITFINPSALTYRAYWACLVLFLLFFIISTGYVGKRTYSMFKSNAKNSGNQELKSVYTKFRMLAIVALVFAFITTVSEAISFLFWQDDWVVLFLGAVYDFATAIAVIAGCKIFMLTSGKKKAKKPASALGSGKKSNASDLAVTGSPRSKKRNSGQGHKRSHSAVPLVEGEDAGTVSNMQLDADISTTQMDQTAPELEKFSSEVEDNKETENV